MAFVPANRGVLPQKAFSNSALPSSAVFLEGDAPLVATLCHVGRLSCRRWRFGVASSVSSAFRLRDWRAGSFWWMLDVCAIAREGGGATIGSCTSLPAAGGSVRLFCACG